MEAHSPARCKEVKMRVAFFCGVLLLAGCAAASPVDSKIDLPDWFPDIVIPEWILELLQNLPDSIQQILDRLPEIIEAVPAILENIQEIVVEIIKRIPEIIQEFIDRLPELIAQIPALADRLRDIINAIVERIPALIGRILDRLPAVIEAVPGVVEQVKEIYEKIREILEENGWLPDWLPTFPDLDTPEWWPPTIPELPEHNTPTIGEEVSIRQYPGIVQIEVGAGPIWIQGCAGSVLTSFHVLSAARCFSGGTYNPRFRRVRAGSSTRFDGGDIATIADALIHPDYTTFDVKADISIVRLDFGLTISANIAQTAIIPQGFALPSGIGVQLVGWGSTAEGRFASDRNLYAIDLVTVEPSVCTERWSIIPLITISSDKLCVADARYGGRNGDIRDTGAAVYYQNILIGIVSVGAPVGNQYLPVITTNVADYTDWIVRNAV